MFDFINRIHDVFHMFLLKSYKKNNDFNKKPLPIEIKKNTDWKIKKNTEQSDLPRLVSIFYMMIKIFIFGRFMIISHRNEECFESNLRIS